MDSPQTLQQAILFYATPKNCIAEMVAQRWPDGKVICPTCGRNDVTWQEKDQRWQCKSRHSKRKFSVKTGTIMEDSPIGLDKWLMATWMLTNCKNGVSSYQIAKAIGVTQKSAWFMLHRIRLAMKEDHGITTMGGNNQNPIEIDETFVGGKIKNMHRKRATALRANMPAERMEGLETRWDNKVPVMGMLNRETRQVRAKVIPNTRREVLQGEILKNVGWNAHIYTDQHLGYQGVDDFKNFTHRTVNHMNEYVNGRVHTQGIENFWALLKRGLTGTYVAVEPFHLDAYVDEQVFRFNNRRKMDDAGRFKKVLSQVAGKRLTYAEVTGNVGETSF